MTAILASDVFPGLDTTNPLDTTEQDAIPVKFGPEWFSYQREERKKDLSVSEDKQEEMVFNKIDTE